MKKVKAQLWDKMHYLFRDYNDRMIHMYLHYDIEIYEKILWEALKTLVDQCDVLHSSYIYSSTKSFWKINEYSLEDVLSVINVSSDNLEKVKQEALTKCIAPDNKVQLHFTLLKYEGGTDICILMNHMCMDGTDFKYFMKTLCHVYNAILEGKPYNAKLKSGSRAYSTVYESMSYSQKLRAKMLYKNINEKDSHAFPFAENTAFDKPTLLRQDIPAEYFDDLKLLAKQYRCSVNDILLAAYYKAMYKIGNYDKYEAFSISCAVDLRRHWKTPVESGLTNHVAWIQCRAKMRGITDEYLIRAAASETRRYKRDPFMGLHGLPLLSKVDSLPDSASEKLIRSGYDNPYLSMSNIGIIQTKDFTLGRIAPSDAFISGSIKYKPYLLVAASTYENKVTLSSGFVGNDMDYKLVDTLLKLIKENVIFYIENLLREETEGESQMVG